jgi:hypothetical protein
MYKVSLSRLLLRSNQLGLTPEELGSFVRFRSLYLLKYPAPRGSYWNKLNWKALPPGMSDNIHMRQARWRNLNPNRSSCT